MIDHINRLCLEYEKNINGIVAHAINKNFICLSSEKLHYLFE